MEKLLDKNCIEFASALADKVSVPGGGGASSYVGALGIALGNMAANFTIGKKKFLDVQSELEQIIAQATFLRNQLLDLVQDDADSFEPLSKAYALPKDTKDRDLIMEQAVLQALQAPLEMVKTIAQSIDLLEKLSTMCSKLLISDVACGASLSKSALECASINVFINTKSLQDRNKAKEIEKEVDSIVNTYLPKAQKIVDTIVQEMRG